MKFLPLIQAVSMAYCFLPQFSNLDFINLGPKEILIAVVSIPPVKSVSQTLAKMKNVSVFYSALEAAGEETILDGPGGFPYSNFTVFAPTNAAFEKLKSRGLGDLFDQHNKRKLQSIVSFHLVPERFLAASLKDGQELRPSHNSMKLTISKSRGHIWVKGGTAEPVELQTTDILCDNGVIHVIDEVLVPSVWRAVPTTQSSSISH